MNDLHIMTKKNPHRALLTETDSGRMLERCGHNKYS
jgi:hypothetical protein